MSGGGFSPGEMRIHFAGPAESRVGGEGQGVPLGMALPELFFSPPPAGDETYQDIFRDFSQMASNNPEKLKRFQPPDAQKP